MFVVPWLMQTARMPYPQALALNIETLALLVLLSPVAGLLADRIGCRRAMLLGLGILIAGAWGCLRLMQRPARPRPVRGAVLAFGLALAMVPIGPLMADALPRRTRVTGIALAYGAAVGICGGLAPMVVKWLMRVTDDGVAPAQVVMAVGALSGAALLLCSLLPPGQAPPCGGRAAPRGIAGPGLSPTRILTGRQRSRGQDASQPPSRTRRPSLRSPRKTSPPMTPDTKLPTPLLATIILACAAMAGTLPLHIRRAAAQSWTLYDAGQGVFVPYNNAARNADLAASPSVKLGFRGLSGGNFTPASAAFTMHRLHRHPRLARQLYAAAGRRSARRGRRHLHTPPAEQRYLVSSLRSRSRRPTAPSWRWRGCRCCTSPASPASAARGSARRPATPLGSP